MELTRRKILDMIETGRITASEGMQLLGVLKDKNKKKRIKLTLCSSQQEEPYLEFSLPVSRLESAREVLANIPGNELISKIHFGRFRIDLGELNWQRIMELIELEEGDELLVLEMPGQNDEEITLQIELH